MKVFLSLSGVVLGILLAVADYNVSWTAALSLICASAALHSYLSSRSRLSLILSVVLTVATAYFSFGALLKLESLVLMLFGYFIIRMVIGLRNGHGRLLDGILTCLITGPVAVMGAFFVCTHSFGNWVLLFPAFSIGLLSVAASGLDDGYGKWALSALTLLGMSLMTVFACMRMFDIWHYLFVLTFPLFFVFISRIWKQKGQASDRDGSLLVLSVSAMSVLTGLGFVAYLIF